jgi:hypothetical protein
MSVLSKEKTQNERKLHTLVGVVRPHSPLRLSFVTVSGPHVGVSSAASALHGCGGVHWGWGFGLFRGRLAFGVSLLMVM